MKDVFQALPAAELIAAGLRDLEEGTESIPALVVSIGVHRLRATGLTIANPIATPEQRLFDELTELYDNEAHSRYNAYIRRLVSYQRARERICTHLCTTMDMTDSELVDLLNAAGSEAVAEFASILEKKVIAERIPTVIRRNDDLLEGRSLLDVLRAGGIERIRDYFDRLFSYVP
jgi:hypothetical protein